eukprot:Amastigsp_a841292_31.p4 type:complete len:107 gc:universal Amastigsp_a841292_31:1155-835(-)
MWGTLLCAPASSRCTRRETDDGTQGDGPARRAGSLRGRPRRSGPLLPGRCPRRSLSREASLRWQLRPSLQWTRAEDRGSEHSPPAREAASLPTQAARTQGCQSKAE